MSDPLAPAPERNRNASVALWRIAERFLTALFALFGSPSDIAQRHTLTRKAPALMARWLAAGEALMRRLLLVEAQALTSKPTTPRKRHPRVRSLVAFHPDAPEEWRVSFNGVPLDRPRLASAGRRGRRGSIALLPAWTLALRLEALLRVFNAPLPYARRLARRLARTATALKPMLKMRAELRPLIGEDELLKLEHRAAAAFADSS